MKSFEGVTKKTASVGAALALALSATGCGETQELDIGLVCERQTPKTDFPETKPEIVALSGRALIVQCKPFGTGDRPIVTKDSEVPTHFLHLEAGSATLAESILKVKAYGPRYDGRGDTMLSIELTINGGEDNTLTKAEILPNN